MFLAKTENWLGGYPPEYRDDPIEIIERNQRLRQQTERRKS